jgi:hypothetical protein
MQCESAFRVIKSRLRWVRHAAHINNRNANWKERLPQRVWCSWKDDIKTDLNIEWRGMYWAQNRHKWWAVANMVMTFQIS